MYYEKPSDSFKSVLRKSTEGDVDPLILCINIKTQIYLTYIKSINSWNGGLERVSSFT